MPTNLRKLGVWGESLPTKKSKVVRAAAFNIGAIIAHFERRYKVAMECNSFAEFQQKFGDNLVSTYYGYDAVQGFFNNAVGVDAKLWIKSHVGYTGSAFDGVAATDTLQDILGTAPTAGYATISNTGTLGAFTGVTVPAIPTHADYALKVTVNGTPYTFATISINVADDWNDIAAAIQTALRMATSALETVVVTDGKIKITSATTGASSSILIEAGTGGSGDLLAAISGLGTTYDSYLDTPVNGVASTDTLRIDAAYQEELDYSDSGNRTGYKIENGSRFTTACNGAPATGNSYVNVDSVSGIRIGDIVRFYHATGGIYVYKKVTALDESLGRITFSGSFGSSVFIDGDVVDVLGFKVKTYRKSMTGIETEVETDLGKIWCTMEPEVSDYYVQNVHATNHWIQVTDLSDAGISQWTFPADVSTVTYLTSGANGTSPSTAAHWSQDLLAFNNKPIRFIANPETTTEAVQKAIETYCRGRWDLPKVIYNVLEDQTKAQYITIGNNYQRSDDVLGVINCDWFKVTDPFSSSNIAPDRSIPNVGHTMGAWVRSIATHGIHYIPSTKDIPIFGINGITRNTADPDYDWDDDDRTDLAEAGINITDFIQGSGFIIRNFFTPSTTLEFQFANGILMREYIKISAVDSLQTSENTPNSLNRIKEDKMAILNFLLRLWRVGSTGNAPEGETFGISQDEQGNPTTWEDHIQVQADAINNPQSSINAGERNIDIWFSYPAPAGSIKIGCGILLLS